MPTDTEVEAKSLLVVEKGFPPGAGHDICHCGMGCRHDVDEAAENAKHIETLWNAAYFRKHSLASAELPSPPWRVLAKISGVDDYHDAGPHWFVLDYDGSGLFVQHHDDGLMTSGQNLTVVPHPLNDPEAVAMIERAKSDQGVNDA